MMMDEFLEILNAPLTDWPAEWGRRKQEIDTRTFMHVAAEVAESIARERSLELAKALHKCRDEYRFSDADALLAQYEIEIQGAVLDERRRGRLKPITSEGEVEKNLAAFAACAFRPIEIDSMLTLLRPYERIIAIDIRSIRTSTRTIARSELVNTLKPVNWTSRSGRWEEQFPSEDELRALEEDAEARKNPRPPWADNINTDLPNGRR